VSDRYQLIVIGGGPAGLAAAIAARETGLESVLILERGPGLGGILPQCVHTGFGLTYFQEELTGPEYARRFIEKVQALRIEYKTSTTVLSIGADKTVVAVNDADGYLRWETEAVVLATGCRERPRGAISITGTRPAACSTANAAPSSFSSCVMVDGSPVVPNAMIASVPAETCQSIKRAYVS